MSSSAPKQQLARDVELFAYVEARPPSEGPAAGGESHADQARRQQAEAFAQGQQAAAQQMRADFEAALGKSREEIARSVRDFAAERGAYYRRIEREVVELALAIARKILHREAQIDPRTLAGIVRVTLEKLDGATEIALRVSPQEAADWRHYFACQMGDAPAPEVREDPAVAAGQCRIETSLGATELGLESQLQEIEAGLLDLLAERPGADPPGREKTKTRTVDGGREARP